MHSSSRTLQLLAGFAAAGAIAVVGAPATASAGTARVIDDAGVNFTVGPGEVNRLQLEQLPGGEYLLFDNGSPLKAGDGCLQVGRGDPGGQLHRRLRRSASRCKRAAATTCSSAPRSTTS